MEKLVNNNDYYDENNNYDDENQDKYSTYEAKNIKWEHSLQHILLVKKNSISKIYYKIELKKVMLKLVFLLSKIVYSN